MAGEADGREGVAVEEAPDSTDEGTVRDAISSSIQEARARLKAGEALVPDEEGEAPPAEKEPVAEGGEEPEGEGLAEAPEGEEAPEPEEEPVAEEEGEAPEAEEEEEGEGEVELVSLPARRPEDGEEDWEIDNPELAERIRQLKNGYLRGEEARAVEREAQERIESVQATEEEYTMLDRELEADPAQFLLERVSDDIRKDVVLAALSSAELFEDPEIQEALRTWEIDPDARKEYHEQNAQERAEQAKKRRQRYDLERRTTAAVRDIAMHVRSFLPEDMPPEEQESFYSAALRTIEGHAMSEGTLDLGRDDIIEVLERKGTFRQWDMEPPGPRSNGSKPSGSRSRRRSSGSRRSQDGSPGDGPSVEEARDTGKRLQEESKKRRSAAAVAPAGAGAPASRVELPRTNDVKERIKLARKKGVSTLVGS